MLNPFKKGGIIGNNGSNTEVAEGRAGASGGDSSVEGGRRGGARAVSTGEWFGTPMQKGAVAYYDAFADGPVVCWRLLRETLDALLSSGGSSGGGGGGAATINRSCTLPVEASSSLLHAKVRELHNQIKDNANSEDSGSDVGATDGGSYTINRRRSASPSWRRTASPSRRGSSLSSSGGGSPLRGNSSRRSAIDSRLVEDVLRNVPVLQVLEPKRIKQLATAFVTRIYSEGEIIVRENEHGKDFFIICVGLAEVRVSGGVASGEHTAAANEHAAAVAEAPGRRRSVSGAAEVNSPHVSSVRRRSESGDDEWSNNRGGNEHFGVVLSRLKTGDFFGEAALLGSGRRMATVLAINGEVSCFVLNQTSFARLVSSDVLVREMTKTIDMRDRQGQQRLKAAEKALVRGMQLHEFSHVRRLGEGGFGKVYLVQHNRPNGELGGVYALKCMKKSQVVAQNFMSSVVAEKQALVDLKHPFIGELVKPFYNGTHLFLLLELIQAGELYQLIKFRKQKTSKPDTALPLPMAQFYASCVVSAMSYMHGRRYMYRDLKPENIMIDRTGYVKLVDFGLVKRMLQDRTYTLCGTREYLAPEIWTGQG